LALTVHLERFEGPLALLLYLIREQEMDIFDININHITKQYLEYIKAMKKLDLEVAGEFVAMAATLIQIKSKMLLPNHDGAGEGEEEAQDPRKELVQRLIEYQKFQKLSKELYERPLLGRDVFARGEKTALDPLGEGEIITEENPLFSLIKSYRQVVRSMKKTVHRVAGELKSIAERILEIKERLVLGQRRRFSELITEKDREDSNIVLVTFLSLLELAKIGFVSLFQSEALTEIHVETKKIIEKDVVSQVEGYENVNAEAAAEAIIHKSVSLKESEPVQGDSEDAQMNLEESLEYMETEGASDEEIMEEERRMEMGENLVEVPDTEAIHNLTFIEDSPEQAASEEIVEETVALEENKDPEVEA